MDFMDFLSLYIFLILFLIFFLINSPLASLIWLHLMFWCIGFDMQVMLFDFGVYSIVSYTRSSNGSATRSWCYVFKTGNEIAFAFNLVYARSIDIVFIDSTYSVERMRPLPSWAVSSINQGYPVREVSLWCSLRHGGRHGHRRESCAPAASRDTPAHIFTLIWWSATK